MTVAHIDVPQIFQDVDLRHEPQLLFVALPGDEFDGDGRGAMQQTLVHLHDMVPVSNIRRPHTGRDLTQGGEWQAQTRGAGRACGLAYRLCDKSPTAYYFS